ncbi:NAD(P)-binding protein [Trichoderma citrinoviride]|uniref:NAD(P)-binding protein n=1 Tax=Trichoderma citrinoviride TaxID=58853 RepID=A0A2T4BG45_9HYPO|nr:NAD(P)-binding protein [Trichoderma citrinoviride]PTB68300.1 NAD(P)-binding protein [Trichoderma citrinoviride]
MSPTVVLVTGANRGIGYEIIKALVQSPLPYKIFLAARDPSKGESAASSLRPLVNHPKTSISVLQLDVSSPPSIQSAAEQVRREAGRLDVLVNNAGIVDQAPDPLARLRNTLEVNTIGPFAVTQAFKPLLKIQPEGEDAEPKTKRIIHVSSGLGSIGERLNPKGTYYAVGSPEYRMSKAALNMLAACDAYELKDDGVKVFAFDPEFVATTFANGDPEERRKMGALEPSVSGESCRDIIEGKRDAETNKFVSINGKDWPW